MLAAIPQIAQCSAETYHGQGLAATLGGGGEQAGLGLGLGDGIGEPAASAAGGRQGGQELEDHAGWRGEGREARSCDGEVEAEAGVGEFEQPISGRKLRTPPQMPERVMHTWLTGRYRNSK